MTPENSEQPRETREGLPLVERFDRLAAKHAPDEGELEDAEAHAEAYKANDAARARFEVQRAKVSSPELASLAAKYVNTSAGWLASMDGDMEELARDVRSLAASVLAQAEGNPRK